MRLSTHILSLTMLFSAAFTGCTVGPDYQRPQTIADQANEFYNAGSILAVVDDPNNSRWWTRFGDPVTNELVESVLKNNLDIKIAAAGVLTAQANYRIAAGGRMPQIDYGFNGNRSRTAFDSGPNGWDHSYSTLFSHQLSVSYVVDLFGRLQRTEEAAWARVLAGKADQQAIINTVIASVVQSRVNIATQQSLLQTTQNTSQSRSNTLELIERRYRSGLSPITDLYLARENLAASQALENTYESQARQEQLFLDSLLNRVPGSSALLVDTLPYLPDIGPVPAGLPATLLERRPDIQAAEMRLAAATAQVGVNMAQLYPNLTLTASGGFRSDDLADLLSAEHLVYSAIAAVAQPIFHGGQLQAQVDAAKAQLDAAAASYAKTIVTALREVESALVREHFLRRRIELLQQRVTQAKLAEDSAMSRYQTGVSQLLLVLDTQRRRLAAESELQLAKSSIWNARIDLFLAIGGDWTGNTTIPGQNETVTVNN